MTPKESNSRLVSGGYVFIQPIPRTDCWDPRYHPETVLSASTCLCKQAPADWMFSWCKCPGLDRLTEAAHWAIEPTQVKQLAAWMDEALESGKIAWPGMMFSLETAREFADNFLKRTKQRFCLVGMSLPHDLTDRLLESAQDSPDTEWHSPYVAIKQANAPASGGRVMGYEILGYEYGLFHSWLCNNLVPGTCTKLEMKLNAMGFIDDTSMARRAAECCGDLPAEPVAWLPWLLQAYDIRSF